MKVVKSKWITPRQGIYAKLKRMAPFGSYLFCTRGINLLKYHLTKFWATCTGVYPVVRRIPSINPYRLHLENPHSLFKRKSSCFSCQPMIKLILQNLNKLWTVQTSFAVTAVTNLETWKLSNLALLLEKGERGIWKIQCDKLDSRLWWLVKIY